MERHDFRNPSGNLLDCRAPDGSTYLAFVPAPLPPPQEASAIGALVSLLANADNALGKLDGVGSFLPNPDLLVHQYKRREAVLSSRIEGTQTSFTELVAYEALQERPSGDAREVFNYLTALDFGLRNVESGISRELLSTMHSQLMSGSRGEGFATPGMIRTIQNHIAPGGTPIQRATFVPPPAEQMQTALDQLLGYLGEARPGTPTLVEAAWMHYQFEAIHPFLDGNGRLGRALIPLLLSLRQRLEYPLLYLSPYFESHRAEYYARLFAVSTDSDWEGWLRFFLEAVFAQAQADALLAKAIVDLRADWETRLHAVKAPHNAHRLADLVYQRVALDTRTAERELKVSPQTASNTIQRLVEVGILAVFGQSSWRRLFYAPELNGMLQGDR